MHAVYAVTDCRSARVVQSACKRREVILYSCTVVLCMVVCASDCDFALGSRINEESRDELGTWVDP